MQTGREPLVRYGTLGFAIFYLLIGALQLFVPGTFFAEIGPFGERNDHYLRDSATFHFAVGAGLLAAFRWPSWRLPMLAIVAFQMWTHTVNHLVDIGEADPEWIGVFDFISLAAGAVLATVLVVTLVRDSN